MSIFSSKTRVSVSSTALNLIDSGGDITAASVVSSILGNTPIVEDLIENQLHSILPKINRAVQYAESDYTYGLPQGARQIASGNETAIEAVLAVVMGNDVEVVSSVILILDSTVYEWPDHTTTTGLIKEQLYYFVSYLDLGEFGEYTTTVKRWVYRVGSNTHPTLTVTAESALGSPYYPVIPIRRDNVDLTDPSLSATDLHITSTKLLGMMGLDYAALGSAINENPDVGEIDHAYVMFGVAADSTDRAAIRYMYQYFSYLHGISNYTALRNVLWQGGTKKSGPEANVISMEDAGQRMQVSYTNTEMNVRTGNIGAIGHVTKDIIILEPTAVTRTYTYGDEDAEMEYIMYMQEHSYMIFQEQISPTRYLELKVHGLVHTNMIYQSHSVETTLAMAVTPDDHNFIIPLNQAVVQNLGAKDRTNLMYDALKIVFNSYALTKVKWYESSFFTFLIKVVGIAITIYSMGADGGWGATLAAGMGIAAGSVAFSIATMLLNMAIGMAIGEAFKIFAKVVGLDNAFLVALASLAYAAYGGMSKGGMKGMPWAEELLFVGNAAAGGITSAAQEVMKDLSAEMTEFWEYTESQWEMLEETKAGLDMGTIVDPADFISSTDYAMVEAPQDFYSRTIHTGNVGVLSLGATAGYVETMLQLPTVGSTINNLNFIGA